MGHRAEQIIDAARSLIAAQSDLGVNPSNVFAMRTLSLADEHGELNAISVDFGDDSPTNENGTDNYSLIDSELTLRIISYVKAPTEQDAKTALLNQRRRIHQALMASQTLGLLFVVRTAYGGASQPEINSTTDSIVAVMESRWIVLYRMNITDPGDA